MPRIARGSRPIASGRLAPGPLANCWLAVRKPCCETSIPHRVDSGERRTTALFGLKAPRRSAFQNTPTPTAQSRSSRRGEQWLAPIGNSDSEDAVSDRQDRAPKGVAGACPARLSLQAFLDDEHRPRIFGVPHVEENMGQPLVGLRPEIFSPALRRLARQPVEPALRIDRSCR